MLFTTNDRGFLFNSSNEICIKPASWNRNRQWRLLLPFLLPWGNAVLFRWQGCRPSCWWNGPSCWRWVCGAIAARKSRRSRNNWRRPGVSKKWSACWVSFVLKQICGGFMSTSFQIFHIHENMYGEQRLGVSPTKMGYKGRAMGES